MVNLHLVVIDDIGFGLEELTSDSKHESVDDAIEYAKRQYSFDGIGRITNESGAKILAWVEWSSSTNQPKPFTVTHITDNK